MRDENIFRSIAEDVNADPMDSIGFRELVTSSGDTMPEKELPLPTELQTPQEIIQKVQAPEDKSFLEKLFSQADPNFATAISPTGTVPTAPKGTETPQAGKAAVQAGVGLVESVSQLAYDIANWSEDVASDYGIGQGDLLTPYKIDWKSKVQSPDDNPGTKILAELMQYMAPGIGVAAKMKLGIKGAAAANVLMDAALMDPNQDRLADVITNAAPELRDWVAVGNALKYLEHSDPEGNWEGRFKNGLESFFVNSLFLTPSVAKTFYGHMKAQHAIRTIEKAASTAGAVPGAAATAATETLPETAAQTMKIVSPLLDVNSPSFGKFKNLGGRSLDDIVPRTTNAATETEARALLVDEKARAALFDKPNIEAMTPVEQQAYRIAAVEASNEFTTLLKTLDLENDADLAKAFDHFAAMTGVSRAEEAAGRVVAQSLQVRQAEIGTTLKEFESALVGAAKLQFIRDKIKFAGGKEQIKSLFKDLRSIETMEDVARFNYLQKITSEKTVPKMLRSLQYGMFNSMLGVKSFTTAMAGNMFNTMIGAADNLAYMGIRGVGTTDAYRSLRGLPLLTPIQKKAIALENAAIIKGYANGTLNSIRGMTDGMRSLVRLQPKYEPSVYTSSKVSFAPKGATALEQMGIGADANLAWKTWGRLMQVNGMGGLPTKLLGKADEFFGGLNYHMQLSKLVANRIVEQNGGVDAFETLYKQMMKDPPIDLHRNAMDFADSMVLARNAPENSIVGVINNSPYLKTILPFTRVTYNTARFALEHSPFEYFTKRYDDIMKFGTQLEKDEAMAKIIVGSTALSGISIMAALGEINGAVSPNWRVNQALADSGKEYLPYSIHGVSIEKLDTIRPWIDLGHTLASAKRYMEQGQFDDLAVNVSASLMTFFTANSLLENISDVVDLSTAIANGDVKTQAEAAKFLSNFAGRFAPKLMKEGTTAYEAATQEEVYKRRLKESGEGLDFVEQLAKEIRNKFATTIPAFNNDLPVARNVFGEPQLLPAGIIGDGPNLISPFIESRGEESEVMQKLRVLANASEEFGPLADESLRLAVSMPGTTIRIPNNMGGVSGMPFEMNPEQYDRYMQYFGNTHPGATGPTLRQQTERAINKVWPKLEKGMTKEEYRKAFNEIHKVFTEAGRRAKYNMLYKEKDFADAYQRKADSYTSERINIIPSSMLGQ